VINPLNFVQQVRVEASKIIWPTRRETVTTTVMVFIMATIVAIFFFLIDSIIGKGLELILTIGS
jgi:preprotein translocase subunit SecE